MKLNFSPCVFFVVIQTVLLFIGCNSNDSRNNKSNFDITNIKVFENVLESVLSSEIMDDVEYITLESDSNSIIGKIDKFLLTDSYIYVMDAEQSKRIFQFDSNGSFIRVIGNYGRGPGEYQKLVDFTICELTNRIFVLDINRKLIIYDLHGDLLSEMRINQGDPLSSRILSYNNELYLYTGRGGNYSSVYSLVQLDSEGNQNIGYLKFENYPNHSISIASPIYVINGNLKMFDLFEGVLLTMEQDQFKEEFLFDFTNRTIPVDVLCSFDKYINNIHNYSIAGQYFVEGQNHIYYLVVDKMQFKHGFFFKFTGKSILVNSVINDEHIFRNPELFWNGFYYCVVEPLWLYDEFGKYRSIIEENSIELSGNPLLMKYKIVEDMN